MPRGCAFLGVTKGYTARVPTSRPRPSQKITAAKLAHVGQGVKIWAQIALQMLLGEGKKERPGLRPSLHPLYCTNPAEPSLAVVEENQP